MKSRFIAGLAAVFSLAFSVDSHAQNEVTAADLTGHWRGAIIDGASVLNIAVEIAPMVQEGTGGLGAATRIDDWLWYGYLDPDPVTIGEAGQITIEGFYGGDAGLEYDPAYRQLVGTLGGADSETGQHRRLHLKPMPAPPAPRFTAEEVRFASADGTQLAGTLVIPAGDGPHPGMVIINGRGCSYRYQDYGQERLFGEYGMATLYYDKRGAGESEGDCDSFTQSDLTDDAQAGLAFLQARPRVDAARTGMKASSAGTWVIQNVMERALADPTAPRPAWLVAWIGPSTSIIQQQRSSAIAIGEALGLNAEQLALVEEVLSVSTSETLSDREIFEQLTVLEQQIDAQGWKDQMFGDTDFVDSVEDVPALWIRRFAYDPAAMLEALSDTPYLSVLGEDDPVVPYAENVSALEQAMSKAGNEVYRIVGIPGQGHSFEHGDETVALPSGETYFKFDTVEPLYVGATVDFLRANGFMP